MSVKRKKIIAFLALFLGACTLWSGAIKLGIFSLQDNSKNTVRILVDRLPHSLSMSQPLDIVANKFLPLLQSGKYRIYFFNSQSEIILSPTVPTAFTSSIPNLKFIYVADELTRALTFYRSDYQAEPVIIFNALNISKTEWLSHQKTKITAYSAPGANLSFLGFNLNDPYLKNLDVRKAIRMALPIKEWAHLKWKDLLTPVKQNNLDWFNPEESKKTLSIQSATQPNIPLRYLTTSTREGYETALLVQEALRNVGLVLDLKIVEPSQYFARLKQNKESLFSSRIIRLSPSDPVIRYLKTGADKNYFNYSNAELDHFFESHPLASFDQVAPWIDADIPFVPLYTWNQSLMLNHHVHFKHNLAPTLDETFRFLLDIELE